MTYLPQKLQPGERKEALELIDALTRENQKLRVQVSAQSVRLGIAQGAKNIKAAEKARRYQQKLENKERLRRAV